MAQWSWLDFFTEAGVPEGHCESYADVFEDNRITEDMLSELDREILQAMGVAVMGDVLRILKHAKLVLERAEKDKIALQRSAERKAARAKKPVTAPVAAAAAAPPAKAEAPRKQVKKVSKQVAAAAVESEEEGEEEEEVDEEEAMEEDSESEVEAPPRKSGKSKPKPKPKKTQNAKYYRDEDGNVKPVRKVPREHEGSYSIIVGKSRAQRQDDKPAVFSRLGKASAYDKKKSPGGAGKTPAVFSRLGGKGNGRGGQRSVKHVHL